MLMSQIIESCSSELTQKYGDKLLPSHRKALDAMLACRRHCGEFQLHCGHCDSQGVIPLSCGHRSCPQCQQHLGTLWLERQKQKLLPVDYFMVTFTVPQECRELMWQHQSIMYELLFQASVEAIKTVGRNNHQLELAMTGVLHTHKRDKGYHPHVHFIVPGGGISRSQKRFTWKAFEERFFVNEVALATVFRGIFLRMLFEQAIDLPDGLPKQWVAHIKTVGRGEKALAYLSRYLYRGVISENDILSHQDNEVTFRYRESKTHHMKTVSLKAEDFIWRILHHVLPRGFRRVRDYGFLHANAKTLLRRIQLLLTVKLEEKAPEKTKIACKICRHPMEIILVTPKRIPMLFRFYLQPSVHKPPS